MKKNATISTVVKHRFYKQNNFWYIDLPEFLEAGLGNQANLMMVAGSDKFLDLLSENGSEVLVKFSGEPFKGHTTRMEKKRLGMDKVLLDSIGHPEVDYGAYYNVSMHEHKPFSHELWLCPVTEYVFGGIYPDTIYVKKTSK